MSRRKEPPSPEDRALWDAVRKGVRPLGKASRVPRQAPRRISPSPAAGADDRASRPPAAAMDPARSPASTGGIEPRRRRRIVRGRERIDSRLDLHGLDREEAYRRLCRHLTRAAHAGERLVLVITGKGGPRLPQDAPVPAAFRRRADFAPEGGVLRRLLPLWLESPELAPLVQACEAAARHDGGDGAFYVLLRRARGHQRM